MFSPLLLLAFTLGVIATLPPTTFIDANGEAHTIEERSSSIDPYKISPRFVSGGFYDKCKDVRFYLSKADDDDPKKNGFKEYKSSPWLVAKCPDKNGNYKCTWLALSKCLLNSDGELYRGKNGNFHQSCTACKLTGSMFNCGCWSGLKPGLQEMKQRVFRTTIDLNVAVGAVDGYLTCHGNWGILDYCSGRPSHDPFSITCDDKGKEVFCWEPRKNNG